jgi:hypothetical protein
MWWVELVCRMWRRGIIGFRWISIDLDLCLTSPSHVGVVSLSLSLTRWSYFLFCTDFGAPGVERSSDIGLGHAHHIRLFVVVRPGAC